jgi:hypothetical protein
MTDEQQTLRDWHRLFGLLLTDFFTDSPFVVEVERDLSMQQQLLDVVIVRRGQGRFAGQLPDGLEGLAAHNLITFKSHHEALDDWAMKELIYHYVAYRKLVSPSTSELLPEEHFKLYAVCARFPQNLSRQVQWQKQLSGVYDCSWGTDTIRIIVAGELSRVRRNAPLHLFSAKPELVGYGQGAYKQHSADTSTLLKQLFDQFRGERLAMYTMQDFRRDFIKERLAKLTPQEQEEVMRELPPEARLAGLPPEARLAGLSEDQIQQMRKYLESLTATRKPPARKPRRKK